VRLLRLALRNYRGTREREIHFAPRGVTVVHGPNEIGKSSLAEAIDLVFEELDSAEKQRVRAVRPVDRDAGSEIEIEVETGPYRFTLSKRFHRQQATQLRVERPRPESWTGREAHQRVEAILDETLDRELWRALRVEQGRGLEQAGLLGGGALASALDRAAGVAAGGAREETLLEAARQESLRYFTPTGRERRDLDARSREVARLRHIARELETALHALERDVARDAELRTARPALEREAREAEVGLREAEAGAARSEGLREALATAQARCDAAALEERQAAQETRTRSQLVAGRAAHEADATQRADELESAEPELLAARAEQDHAAGALHGAREACEAAAHRESLCRAELELLRGESELAELRQREARIARAEAGRAEAAHALESAQLDAARAEAIRVAEHEVVRRRDRLEVEGPLVRIAAEADLELTLDGRSLRLAAGETLSQRVSDSLLLSLPGVAELGVVAGAGTAALRKQLEEAHTRWRGLCIEAGVEDHADALRALAHREESLRARSAAEQTLRELLAGETREALSARVQRLAQRVALARSSAAALGGAPSPAEIETAAGRLAEAERAHARAREAFQAAAARLEASAARARDLEERHHETEVRLELARQALADLEARLEIARADCSDEELSRRLDTRATRARAREIEAQEAARLFEVADPSATQASLVAARRRLELAHAALRACRDEAIEIATRLELRGEEGLFEQLEETQAALLRAEREESGERRRAEAARLLYTTLQREREASHRAYAGPLRARIESLGAEVFGPGFRVDLDDALRVASRTQNGVVLAFDQLSAGAREQLALLARLACATLVAEDGGAPVLLDDALGHSDPRRLEGLGRVLAEAGQRCQIIVLTCDPARYRHVAGAQLVELISP
jgi:hypothetical protein